MAKEDEIRIRKEQVREGPKEGATKPDIGGGRHIYEEEDSGDDLDDIQQLDSSKPIEHTDEEAKGEYRAQPHGTENKQRGFNEIIEEVEQREGLMKLLRSDGYNIYVKILTCEKYPTWVGKNIPIARGRKGAKRIALSTPNSDKQFRYSVGELAGYLQRTFPKMAERLDRARNPAWYAMEDEVVKRADEVNKGKNE